MTGLAEFDEFVEKLYFRYNLCSRARRPSYIETGSGLRVVSLFNEDISLRYMYRKGEEEIRYGMVFREVPVVGFSSLKKDYFSDFVVDRVWYSSGNMTVLGIAPEYERELFEHAKELMQWAHDDYHLQKAMVEVMLNWPMSRADRRRRLAGKKLT